MRKVFDKNSTAPYGKKILNKFFTEGIYLNTTKAMSNKPTTNIILMEKS
jgi:hypothetical protein